MTLRYTTWGSCWLCLKTGQIFFLCFLPLNIAQRKSKASMISSLFKLFSFLSLRSEKFFLLMINSLTMICLNIEYYVFIFLWIFYTTNSVLSLVCGNSLLLHCKVLFLIHLSQHVLRQMNQELSLSQLHIIFFAITLVFCIHCNLFIKFICQLNLLSASTSSK